MMCSVKDGVQFHDLDLLGSLCERVFVPDIGFVSHKDCVWTHVRGAGAEASGRHNLQEP